jgi:uncharacterized RDD family membrane protein YckC
VGSIDTSTGYDRPTTTTDAAPDDLILADVPSRLIGYALDAVILTVLVFVAAIVVSAILGPTVRFDDPEDVLRGRVTVDRGLALANGLVSTAISGLFFVGTWTFLGGSPGMRLLGLRLGRERDGGRVSLRSSVVRWLLLGAPFGLAALLAWGVPALRVSVGAAATAWYLILLVTTVRSATRQGLHDHYSHTMVTKTARRPSWAGRG